jgi:hypothetical protein
MSTTDEKQTFVQFQHTGWREYGFSGSLLDEMGRLFLSLKVLLERGKGLPYPYDLEVHYR